MVGAVPQFRCRIWGLGFGGFRVQGSTKVRDVSLPAGFGYEDVKVQAVS